MRPVIIIILSLILLLIAVICFTKLRIAVKYDEGFTIYVSLGFIKIRVYPGREKKSPKKRRKKKPSENAPEKEESKPLDIIGTFSGILGEIKDVVGRLRDDMRIERFDLSTVIADSDPASAAITYGAVSAAVGILVPAVESNFAVNDKNIFVDLDFERKDCEIKIDTVLALHVRHVIRSGLTLIRALSAQGRKNNDNDKKAVST